MNNSVDDNIIRDFLSKVCAPIKARELHKEIKSELESHIAEIIELKLQEGVEADIAVQQAIKQMGDPLQLGRQLHQAHKPRMDWSLIAIISAFIGIGLLSMYEVYMSIPYGYSGVFTHKIFYAAIGIVIMILFFFLDYRKIKPYCWKLYILTLAIMVYVILFGSQYSGIRMLNLGFIQIDFFTASPYLLIISTAGILSNKSRLKYGAIADFSIFIMIPGFLYWIAHSFTGFIVYFISCIFLLVFTKKSWTRLLTTLAPLPIFMIFAFMSIRYSSDIRMIERFTTFLHPYKDPSGAGYMVVQSLKAIRSAGMNGHGFGVQLKTLPAIQSDMIFTYLIYSLGWIMGLIVAAFVVLFILRIWKVAGKIHDPFGQFVIIGLCVVFSVQFIWHILMSVSLLPMLSMPLPFISFDASQSTLELAVIGIILSIYRRKDMIRKVQSHSDIQVS
jgi:cell division protein FtsW (lipid II flippase)